MRYALLAALLAVPAFAEEVRLGTIEETEDGEVQLEGGKKLELEGDIEIERNGSTVRFDDLEVGDEVRASLDAEGDIIKLEVTSPDEVTPDDEAWEAPH